MIVRDELSMHPSDGVIQQQLARLNACVKTYDQVSASRNRSKERDQSVLDLRRWFREQSIVLVYDEATRQYHLGLQW